MIGGAIVKVDGNKKLTFYVVDIPVPSPKEEKIPWTDDALADLEWAARGGRAIIIPDRHEGHRIDVLYHSLWDAYRRSPLVDRYTLRTKRVPGWPGGGGTMRPAIQAWLIPGAPAAVLHPGLEAAKRVALEEVKRLRLETAASPEDRPALVRGAEAVVKALERASYKVLQTAGGRDEILAGQGAE